MFSIDIDIKSKKTESGSSGGFMTTLAIYNALTEKDITKGYKIAGTGTIEPDGSMYGDCKWRWMIFDIDHIKNRNTKQPK